MPEELDWPTVMVRDEDGESYDDPLTFVCQIRCADIAPFDPHELLPHEGMLYFFAAIDYFLGDFDTPAYPGMGEWKKEFFRVHYSPSLDQLHTHHLKYPDGTQATMPAEAISFEKSPKDDDGLRLLGYPYIEDVRQEMTGWLSLLQVDESVRWGLTFHDSGTLNFLITPEDLRQRRWDRTTCYLFSF
jgi:uncharacterized protein YwqG